MAGIVEAGSEGVKREDRRWEPTNAVTSRSQILIAHGNPNAPMWSGRST
jgi:hypothetical protein